VNLTEETRAHRTRREGRALVSWIRRVLFGHPVKSFVNVFFGLAGNVLAGAYILDITRSATGALQYPDWKATPYSPSFWGAVAVFVVFGLYSWRAAVHEAVAQAELARLQTNLDLNMQALQALLPSLIEEVKGQIARGEVKTMDQAFGILGLGRDRQP
jgi:hypothetical protein